MTLVVVKDLRLWGRGNGPLVRMDLQLNGSRYGTGGSIESVDEAELAYASDDVAELLEVAEVMLSVEEVRKGVGGCTRLLVEDCAC